MFGVPPLIRHTRECMLELSRAQLVEPEIKLQYINTRLAQEPEESPFRVLDDELAHTILRQITRLGNAGDLEECALRRDIRVEAAGRRRTQILRDGRCRRL